VTVQFVTPQMEPPRAVGCILWLYEGTWESAGDAPPTPFDEWADTLRARGWTVHWTLLAAISKGPYRGGSVVEVDVDGDRGYAAVPPELLDRLAALTDAQGYRMVREDVAALDNPHARGVLMTRLDSVAWEQHRELVPIEELLAEAWARTVRQNGLQVEIAAGSLSLLPLGSAWPAGQVIAVTDGAHRSYVAAPRAALPLAIDLSVEMETPRTVVVAQG